jgi:hypothetical protein
MDLQRASNAASRQKNKSDCASYFPEAPKIRSTYLAAAEKGDQRALDDLVVADDDLAHPPKKQS